MNPNYIHKFDDLKKSVIKNDELEKQSDEIISLLKEKNKLMP